MVHLLAMPNVPNCGSLASSSSSSVCLAPSAGSAAFALNGMPACCSASPAAHPSPTFRSLSSQV